MTCLTVAAPALAQDRTQAHLDDILAMYGLIFEYDLEVPAAMLIATTDGHTAMRFYGDDGTGLRPDERSLFRIGSISKVLTGHVLAAMDVAGTVRMDMRVEAILPDFATGPMRLLDPATQSSGLPREMDAAPGADGSPDTGQTTEAIAAFLQGDPFLFTPGTSAHYSNVGFQILGAALGAAHGDGYRRALQDLVLTPLAMQDTAPEVQDRDRDRLLPGHLFDGSVLPYYPSGDLVTASGGLFTTAADLAAWMAWNLGQDDDPVRDAFHRVYRKRDEFASVSTMDESGMMDGMGLGWIWMKETPYRADILQKSGAHGGYMSYLALEPSTRSGVFVMINIFDFGAAEQMTALANAILADLPGQLE